MAQRVAWFLLYCDNTEFRSVSMSFCTPFVPDQSAGRMNWHSSVILHVSGFRFHFVIGYVGIVRKSEP